MNAMSRTLGLAFGGALLVSGCKVIDAPENLEDLLVFGFANFDDGIEYNEVAAEGLVPLTLKKEEELFEGYRVTDLTKADVRAAGLEPPDKVNIMGAATTIHMRASLDELAEVLTWPDMTEVQEPMLRWDIHDETDRDCFLAHECETYRVEGERERDVGMFGKATQTFIREWVWVEVDGEQRLIQRELNPDPAEITTFLYKVNQQYAYSVFFPHKKGTQRLECYWIDAKAIGMELPDTFALDLAVKAVHDNADDLDTFIDENL